MNRISEILDQLNDATALALLAIIVVELAYIGSSLAILASKL